MTKIVHFPQLSVQRLDKERIDEASTLLHSVWHATYRGHLPAPIVSERTRDHFRLHLQRRASNSWLALVGDRVVGVCTCLMNCIDDLWVSQQYRRRGIASGLVEAACGQLARHGFHGAQIGCEDFNTAGIALLEHLGWQKAGAELVQVSPDVCFEALIYTCSLSTEEAS